MSWIKDKVFNNADEFIKWLDDNFSSYIDKHISSNHVHHTWSPNHSHYPKYTTLQMHKNMRSFHVNTNGWSDIAQNITIGKDGDIVTGRDIHMVPVSATGHNGTADSHPFAYEMIGNFDKGNDKLEGKQLESAIKISRYFYKKGKDVKFHRELLLPNGKVPKTCPGTGIEKDWFMDLVKDSKYDVGSVVEQPVSKPVETKPVADTPSNQPQKLTIIDKSKIDVNKMATFVLSENPKAKDIKEIAKQFIEVGDKYGVRGDIAFCQSIIETGWFKFDGGTAVTPDQHNYCGMGVTRKGMKGNSFKTVKDGVIAHVQHLFAYACKSNLPIGEQIIDPRFQYVTRGIAPYFEDLSMKWAMNKEYGNQIVDMYKQLVDFKFDAPKVEPSKSVDIKPSGNNYIKNFQAWLNDTYKAGIVVDNVFGSMTKVAALKALQKELNKQYHANLKVDGVWGNKTKDAIRVVEKGDKGNIVRILQGMLYCLKYNTNGFDGVAGNGCEKAVKSFQKANKLKQDGKAGKETFEELFK